MCVICARPIDAKLNGRLHAECSRARFAPAFPRAHFTHALPARAFPRGCSSRAHPCPRAVFARALSRARIFLARVFRMYVPSQALLRARLFPRAFCARLYARIWHAPVSRVRVPTRRSSMRFRARFPCARFTRAHLHARFCRAFSRVYFARTLCARVARGSVSGPLGCASPDKPGGIRAESWRFWTPAAKPGSAPPSSPCASPQTDAANRAESGRFPGGIRVGIRAVSRSTESARFWGSNPTAIRPESARMVFKSGRICKTWETAGN